MRVRREHELPAIHADQMDSVLRGECNAADRREPWTIGTSACERGASPQFPDGCSQQREDRENS